MRDAVLAGYVRSLVPFAVYNGGKTRLCVLGVGGRLTTPGWRSGDQAHGVKKSTTKPLCCLVFHCFRTRPPEQERLDYAWILPNALANTARARKQKRASKKGARVARVAPAEAEASGKVAPPSASAYVTRPPSQHADLLPACTPASTPLPRRGDWPRISNACGCPVEAACDKARRRDHGRQPCTPKVAGWLVAVPPRCHGGGGGGRHHRHTLRCVCGC